MKKIALIMLAAMTMVFAACGNKGGNAESYIAGENKDGKKAEVKVEEAYTTYTNNKYGFSVEVPSELEQKSELSGEDGIVYSAEEKGSTIVFNRIDISGGREFSGEEYTPERVKQEFESWLKNIEVASKECGDDYFDYTIKGEMLTEMHHHVFKGDKVAMIVICYEPEHEKQLGGEVAQHVFNSVKFE